MFELPKRSIVISASHRRHRSRLHHAKLAHTRLANPRGDLLLRGTDREHVIAIVHTPNRLCAQFTDIEFQVRRTEIAPPASDKVSSNSRRTWV